MSGLSLYHMTQEYLGAFHQLADSDFDEATIDDTLEGMEGEIMAKSVNVAAFALNLEAESEAMKAAEDRIKTRRMMLSRRASVLRAYLLENMQRAGITEIAANDKSFRVRVIAGRESVVIDDEAALPADYLRTKTVTEPNKALIAQAIKDGYEVIGAHVERKPSLKID